MASCSTVLELLATLAGLATLPFLPLTKIFGLGARLLGLGGKSEVVSVASLSSTISTV
jgi:hypothetical protein